MSNIEIRVCLTKECNFKCQYCKPGGEGVYNKNKALNKEELLCIIAKLTRFGVGSVRLTGGEPLLRKDFSEIVDELSNLDKINDISLVTNGSLLNEKLVSSISKKNIKEVTVSLDTIIDKKFANIVGVDCFYKVIDGIKLLRKYDVSARINTVVTKENISEIDKLIELCKEYKISLKLLDLFNNGEEYWKNQFVSLSKIRNELSKVSKNTSVKYPNENNFGSPMSCFELDGMEVIIKDSTIGTCYSDMCTKCSLYPCQTGVVSLFLTHDGYLKFCTLSNEFNLDLKPLLIDDKHTYEQVRKIIDLYKESKYLKCHSENETA